MGTLTSQSIRALKKVSSTELSYEIQYMKELCVKHGIELSEAIALFSVLEYRRRTDILVDDGDRKDEQVAGVAEILQELITQTKDTREYTDEQFQNLPKWQRDIEDQVNRRINNQPIK